MVDFAKQNPGKVTYATPGTGTSLHIGVEQIAGMAGIKLTQVPFKGGAETNAAVLGQHTVCRREIRPAGGRWSTPASCGC